MALNDSFYNEILEKEEKWINLINKNLLNTVYCNIDLKPFYIQKSKELEDEYNITKKNILKDLTIVINDIIEKIQELDEEYKNLDFVDMKSLIPLFLTNKLESISKNEDKYKLNELKQQKKDLEEEISKYRKNVDEKEDYLYDDFLED